MSLDSAAKEFEQQQQASATLFTSRPSPMLPAKAPVVNLKPPYVRVEECAVQVDMAAEDPAINFVSSRTKAGALFSAVVPFLGCLLLGVAASREKARRARWAAVTGIFTVACVLFYVILAMILLL